MDVWKITLWAPARRKLRRKMRRPAETIKVLHRDQNIMKVGSAAEYQVQLSNDLKILRRGQNTMRDLHVESPTSWSRPNASESKSHIECHVNDEYQWRNPIWGGRSMKRPGRAYSYPCVRLMTAQKIHPKLLVTPLQRDLVEEHIIERPGLLSYRTVTMVSSLPQKTIS